MGESGRLPERFAAAFVFCPQRRISGAFRTPHRGLRFVIALANTTSISCGRFRAQLALRLPTLRLIFVSADRLFSFSSLCLLPITASIDLRARHDEYTKVLARTLASFRPLRTDFFSFIPCSFSGALLRAATSDSAPYIRLCGQTFFLFFVMPFADNGKYRSAARFSRVGRSRYA